MGMMEDWHDAVHMIYELRERLDLATSNFDDDYRSKILKHLFCCSLAPIERGKIEIHLLFLLYVITPDELPDTSQMTFSVLDLSWIASQNIQKIRKIIHPEEPDIVDVRVITKRDPEARENLRKWLKGARKQIQRDVQKLLQMDQQAFLQYSSQSIWQSLVKCAGLHPINDEQETVVQELLVNWQGQIVKGEKTRKPLPYDLRRLCQRFSQYLPLPDIRSEFLMQRIPDDEKKNGRQIGAAPFHIGWYDIYGTAVMSGVYTVAEKTALYGSALLRNHPTASGGLDKLLAAAPYEVTVPLLCYGIFSVIKPFVPGYPARISAHEPFSKVIQKQNHLFFLSLTGDHAKDLAKLFFGSFTDYGKEESITEKLVRRIQGRVHDGVVILNRQYKDLQAFRNGALLRDACVVLTNAAFEDNDYEIRLSSDQFCTELNTADMQPVFPNLLITFLDWFQREYISRQKEAVREALGVIADNAENLCCELLWLDKKSDKEFPKKFRKLRDFPAGTWQELGIIIDLYMNRLNDIIEEEYANHAFGEKLKQYDLNKVNSFAAQAKKFMKNRHMKAEDSFVNSLFNLKLIRSQFPLEKSANLQIALFVFRKFMRENPAYANVELPRPWEEYLALDRPSEQDDVKLFFDFLSDKIVAGEIIPFRAERTSACCGWYDQKKELIYMPYPDYFANFRKWLLERRQVDLPNQRIFQQKMADQGLLLLADNHSNSGYMRPDYRIIVDSAADPNAKQRKVIKICTDTKLLTSDAESVLQKLAEQQTSRRRASHNRSIAL